MRALVAILAGTIFSSCTQPAEDVETERRILVQLNVATAECLAAGLDADATWRTRDRYQAYESLKGAEKRCGGVVGQIGLGERGPVGSAVDAASQSCRLFATKMAAELALKAAMANGDNSPKTVSAVRSAVAERDAALEQCNQRSAAAALAAAGSAAIAR